MTTASEDLQDFFDEGGKAVLNTVTNIGRREKLVRL